MGSGDGQWSYHKVAAQRESILIGASHDRDIESLAAWIHEPLQPVRLGGMSMGRGEGVLAVGVGRGKRKREREKEQQIYKMHIPTSTCTLYMYMTKYIKNMTLTGHVRGPWFNPGWPPVFHSSPKIFLSLFITYMNDQSLRQGKARQVHVRLKTTLPFL